MAESSLLRKVARSIRTSGIFGTARKIISDPLITCPFSSSLAKRQARIEARFTKMFSEQLWGGGETVSGGGSTKDATANLRKQLPALLSEFSIRSIFDAPCGDFNWMKSVLAEMALDYTGGDIVKPLIAQNNALHGNQYTRFIHFNIVTDKFPKADIWICRACLYHLSFDETFLALNRFLESGTPYLLTTTCKNFDGFKNGDIQTGAYRHIDLFSEPYNFNRNVLASIDDFEREQMCLWSRDQVKLALERNAIP